MVRLPDFEAWAIFAKVAELGSFSAAATDLNLAKATVSKAVSRLERRLDTPLFHRTSRRLSLTTGGAASLERATRILTEGEAAEEEATAQSAEPRGRVRVTVPLSFGISYVAPLLPAFLARYPKLAVELHLADHVVDIVGEGFDVAIRIGALEDSSLRARRLCGIGGMVVAAPAWFDRHGRPAHPRDLEGADALLYSNLAQPMLWHFTHPTRGDVTVRLASRLIANNGDVLVPALEAGEGIAVLPDFIIGDALKAGRLEVVLADWSINPSSLYIVTPPSALRPTRVRVFIDYFAEALAAAPWEG
jgi:DNA-binding transcriptional LysR family regulator